MAAAARASSTTTSLLAVTIIIALIVPIICGEIYAASAADDGQRSIAGGGELAAPRTFGRIRMLKNIMLPLMFLFGGIKMLLVFLVAIALKTLFIVSSIFVINISIGLAKVINFFKNSAFGHGGGWGHGAEKTVNIHIHTDPGHQLSVDGFAPPSLHSSVVPPSAYPYARSDVVEPVYSTPVQSGYSKVLVPAAGVPKINNPYAGWQQYSRRR